MASLRRRTHVFISVSRSWAPGCESKVGASRREESRVLAETRRSEGQGLESPILGPSACVREGQGGRAGCHIHAEAGYGVRLCPGRQLCTNADSSRQSGGLQSGPVSDGSSLRYIPEAMLSLGTGRTVRYGPLLHGLQLSESLSRREAVAPGAALLQGTPPAVRVTPRVTCRCSRNQTSAFCLRSPPAALEGGSS